MPAKMPRLRRARQKLESVSGWALKKQQESQVREALKRHRETQAKAEALKKEEAAQAKAETLKKKKLDRVKAEALKKQKAAQVKAEALRKRKEAQAKAEASARQIQIASDGVRKRFHKRPRKARTRMRNYWACSKDTKARRSGSITIILLKLKKQS